MGALVLIVLFAILALAIIGLGWQTFFSGIAEGARQVVQNPLVENAASGAKEYLGDIAENTTNQLVEGPSK